MLLQTGLKMVALLAALGGANPTPLLPLNTVEGVKPTMKSVTPAVQITVATGKENTTDGDGALRFGGTSVTAKGNKYVAVMVPLKEPVDLRERRVLLDARTDNPAETQAFYVRFYNQGEAKPAWSFNSWSGLLKPTWRTFSFQTALSPEGLGWETEVVEGRVPDRVDRIELIIGTAEDAKPVSLLADNLRLGERLLTIQDLKQPKALVRETVLVRDGKPAATVLHPDTPAGRDAAQVVVKAVQEQTGVALPARPATKADREPAQTTILLGNVDSNPAMLLLYARFLTPVDSLCPGAGGSLVHTVHDPFGKGVNALVLGASDDAGLARAAEVLKTVVAKQPKGKDLVLARLFERGYAEEFLKRYRWAGAAPDPKRVADSLADAQKALDTGRHTSIAGILQNVANRYAFNGDPNEAKAFVALWDVYVKSAVADPSKYGGPWGFDSDFPSVRVVPGWDIIEEDPVLTDEERLRVTKAMARWLQEAVIPKVGTSATHVPHNHQTFPGMGALMAGLYFTQGFDVLEGPRWLAIADNLFKPQAARFKPHEDCNGYQWLTNGHQMRYAVARPDFALFENGNGKKIVEFLIGNMNNLGYQVPYGDTGSWKCWTSEIDVLDFFAYATGDPAALWTANLKRQNTGARTLHGFMRTGEGKRPDHLNGVKVWPLEPMYYTSHKAEERPPLERCFDKVSFREAMDPQAAYLLLDGLSNGGHKHLDGNSIPQITQFGRVWLADNDYIKAQTKYHNTALVFRDGQATAIPDYAEMMGAGESGRYAFSRTKMSGYSGTDWDRTILWLKRQKAFLVLDHMTAKEAGEYQFRVNWHGVGAPEVRPDGMLLRQKGPSYLIQLAAGPRIRVEDDAELGSNWNGYPHADPVVRCLSATATVNLPAGGSYLYATALHGVAEGEAAPWQLSFVMGGDAVRVKTPEETFVVALGPVNAGIAEVQFNSDAQVLVADDAGLTLLGATAAEAAGQELHHSLEALCRDVPLPEAGPMAAARAARPPVANVEPGGKAPAHPVAWERRPAPQHLLVSGTHGISGAVNLGAKVRSEPAPPAKGNAFDAGSPNQVEAALDGIDNSTTGSVMYPTGQTVSLTLDLGAPCVVERVRWGQWWAVTSSKKTAYVLEKAVVSLSSDDFKADTREVGVVTDAGPHPDFGSPIEYAVAAKGAKARYVRLTLQPKAGTAVYLAEVFVDGRPEGKTAEAAPYTFTHVAPFRTGKAGATGLYAGTKQGDILALNPDGTPRWSVHFAGAVNDVAAADLNGDGVEEAIVARGDCFVTALAEGGKELWSKEIPYYREKPVVALVRTGDINGDGKPEVIAGTNSWRFYAFDAAGTELWNYETVHKSTSGAVVDIDGDGKDEVLCGTEYYSTFALKGDGKLLWSYSMGPIAHDIATGSFDGNKARGAVYGGGDGFLHYLGPDGKARLRFQTGEEVRHVATADLDGDGKDEILAGSQSNNLYCFGADGKQRWRKDLGSEVSALCVTGNRVLAGTGDGGLYTFDKAGAIVAASQLKARVVELKPHDGAVVVVTGDGRVREVK